MNPPNSPLPRGRELICLVVAVLLVLIIAAASYRVWLGYEKNTRQVEISQQIANETQLLMSSLKDAETGQRGFLLTGQDGYLEPFRQSLTAIPASLDRVAVLARERRDDQFQRVEQLRPLVQDKLDELDHTIQLRRDQGQEAALAVVRSGLGKQTMDRIREINTEMQTAARSRIAAFTADARSNATQLALLASVGSLALLVLLISSLFTIRNATEKRMRLIEQLQESSRKLSEARDWLQTTLGSIGDAVIATDAEGRVSFMNGVAETLTGWKSGDAAGKPLQEIFVITNEETGATVENPVTKALREGRVVGLANHTELTQKESGNRIPIDDSAAPIRKPDGRISGVVLVFRDVTERKLAERAAEQSLTHFRAMADHAPVLIWVTGPDKRGSWFNRPWLDFVGRTMEQELGDGWLQNAHPEDLERCLQTYLLAFDAREPFESEYRLRRHDGVFRWVIDRGVPLFSEAGEFTGFIGSCLDITDRIEVESQLRRANADLSQFAFAASHDLQEPLRMITTFTQLLLREHRHKLDGEAAEWAAHITEGTRRMRSLITDLLDYTRISSDDRVAADQVDLNAALEKAMANLKAAIDETGASVASEPLPRVLGREGHFIQLFQNLVDNAIKYRGPQAPQIRVFAEQRDGSWRVSVADNGMGVEPEYHQSIFGVFKRLHGRTHPGTGIGLAICQRVVERYRGRIWVESDGERGSTFYFTLPSA